MQNLTIINRLNDLFEEAIANTPSEDLFLEEDVTSDPAFNNNLKFIRKLNTIAKSNLKKKFWENAKEEISKLIKEVGKSSLLASLLGEPEYKEVNAFFSKFQNVSDQDKESMLLDTKMLELIRKLKSEFKDEENSNK